MGAYLLIKWMPFSYSEQIVLPIKFKSYIETQSKTVIVHVGQWEKTMIATVDNDMAEEIIGMPIGIKKELRIPDELTYDIIIDQDHIHIGPVIGILVSRKKITKTLLERYQDYLWNYQRIKGLIYIFSIKNIDLKEKIIKGYYYYPNSDTLNEKISEWKEGIFPYPAVVYRRVKNVKDSKYDNLWIQVNRKVFNSFSLNKWEVWRLLSKNEQMGRYLPLTILFRSYLDLLNLLDRLDSLYLKPISGSLGSGIVQIQKINEEIIVHFSGDKRIIKKNKLKNFLNYLTRKKTYIVQHDVGLTKENKKIDFRVIMQKNTLQKWVCNGIIARHGLDGGITTNDISSINLGSKSIKSIFQLSDEETKAKEKEIISICSEASELLDIYYRRIGDLGFDISIDSNQKVWIIEINLFQSHRIASYVYDDPDMYKRVVSTPLEYAKSIAGFQKNN